MVIVALSGTCLLRLEGEVSFTWVHLSCLAGLVQASGKHGGVPRVRGCRDEGLRAVCWLMEEEASLTWGPLVSCFAGGRAADSVQALCADKH